MKIPLIGSVILLLLTIACVQATKRTHVFFEVDLNAESAVESVEIRGATPPLSWTQGHLIHDPDGDGIYTGEVIFDIPFDHVEIKFVKNGSEYELADSPNRKLFFETDSIQTYRAVFDRRQD